MAEQVDQTTEPTGDVGGEAGNGQMTDQQWFERNLAGTDPDFDPDNPDGPPEGDDDQTVDFDPEQVGDGKPEDDAEGDEPEDEPKDKPKPKGYDKAVKVLQRDNVPKAVLESMDPEQVIEWADQRKQVQAEVERRFQRLSELEKQEQKARVEVDHDELFSEVEEYLGEDAAKPFKTMFDSLTARLQQAEQVMQSFQQQALEQKMNDIRADLAPDADDDQWQAVVDTMEALAASDKHKNDTLEAIAAKAVAAEGLGEGSRSPKRKPGRSRRSPPIPSRKASSGTDGDKWTQAQYEWKQFQAIQKGDRDLMRANQERFEAQER